MKSTLAGRTLCVIGANGYVGSAVARLATELGAKVYSISRSGQTKENAAWVEHVEWIKGDALKPEEFQHILKESEAVVQTVGTLIDTSFTKFSKPGEPGTYEHMNRDTAKAIGQALNDLHDNKKIVYISASKSPPFIPRYLSTKVEAEKFLLGLPELRTSVLKPGYIYSDQSVFRHALKYPVNFYASLYNFINGITPYEARIKPFVWKFDVDKAVDIRAVAISALTCCFDPKFDDKFLYNKDMNEIRDLFNEHGYEFPSK